MSPVLRSLPSVVTLVLALALAHGAFAAPGDLDTSFGSDGKVVMAPGFAMMTALAVAAQADGKLVAAAYRINPADGDYDVAVARFQTNGSLDTAFGDSGVAVIPLGTTFDTGKAMAVQADGKILVAGSAGSGMGVVRLNADGSLDTTFSGDGKLTIAVGGIGSSANAIALQQDAKIVLAGYSSNGSDGDFAVVRINSDGTLDTGFGGSGMVVTALTGNDMANAVVVQPDGKIVAAGSATNPGEDFAVVRYDVDGNLDTTFSGDGKLVMDIGTVGDVAHAVALQSDGKLLVAGYSQTPPNNWTDFAIVRLHGDGTLDNTFSGDGLVTTNVSAMEAVTGIAVQPDGKVLLGGYSHNGTDRDFALLRYDSVGDLDFGVVLTDLSGADDQANAMTLLPDGKAVVVGGGNNILALARYIVSEPAWGLVPDTMGFTTQSNVTAGATITSEMVTITGLGADIDVPLHITGGSYSLNGAAYTRDFAWVKNGDTLSVRHTASASAGATTSTTLTIGGLAPVNNQALSLGAPHAVVFSSVTVAAAASGGGGGGGAWDVMVAVLVAVLLAMRNNRGQNTDSQSIYHIL